MTCSLNQSRAALAAASTVKVGGGGTVLAPDLEGVYPFIPTGNARPAVGIGGRSASAELPALSRRDVGGSDLP